MQMPMSSSELPDEFATRDLALSAYLDALGVRVVRIEWRGEQLYWIFPASAEPIAASFFQGGTVEARQYHRSLREFRGLSRGRAGR